MSGEVSQPRWRRFGLEDVDEVKLAARHAPGDSHGLVERRPIGVGEAEPHDHREAAPGAILRISVGRIAR